MEGDVFFEDVGVQMVFRALGVRARDLKEVAEFGEEECVVGAFGGSGLLPALYEALRRQGHGSIIAHAEVHPTVSSSFGAIRVGSGQEFQFHNPGSIEHTQLPS